MKHPLALVALCATGAVAVLCGAAVAAFAAPATAQTTVVRGVDPLTVPLGHHPLGFGGPLVPRSGIDRNLVVVAMAGAQTLEGSQAAADSFSGVDSSTTGPTRELAVPALGGPASGPASVIAPPSPVTATSTAPASPVRDDSEAAETKPGKPEKPAKPEKPTKPERSEDTTGNSDHGNPDHGSSDDKSGKKDQ